MGTEGKSERAKSSDILDFLTADEIAAILRTTRKAVYARVSRGQLPPPVKLGRRLFFPRADLLSFFQEKRAASLGRKQR